MLLIPLLSSLVVIFIRATNKNSFTARYVAVVYGLSFVCFVLGLVYLIFFFCYNSLDNLGLFSFNGYLITDAYTSAIKANLLFFFVYFILLTSGYVLIYIKFQVLDFVEFPIILGFSIFFMLLLISSFNLFGAYVSLEGITFSLYILAGLNSKSQSSFEASIKYFCLGSLASGLLLFGLSLVFLITNTLDFLELRYILTSANKIPILFIFSLVFIFCGFWFKLSVFPCHS
jgi:NADH-quinone oxidoreductase subunit N